MSRQVRVEYTASESTRNSKLKFYRLSRGVAAEAWGGIGFGLSEAELHMSRTKCIKAKVKLKGDPTFRLLTPVAKVI